MSPSELSRIFYFNYINDDMLRGTIYYGKRNYYKDLKNFLSERPLYRTIKIIQKEFAVLDLSSEYDKFVDWANQPFSDEDRLYGQVQYFEKQYPVFTNYRFMLRTKTVGDLYLKTQFKQTNSLSDISNLTKKDIRESMK